MVSILLAITVCLALRSGQPGNEPGKPARQTFGQKVESMTSDLALYLAEWSIVPGLDECLPELQKQAPELKGVPEELCSVLQSNEVASRSAGLLYLARLARVVRASAWWRDRDEGEDLLAVALGP